MSKHAKQRITFRSNLQEELSVEEILFCLQTSRGCDLEQKRLVLASIIEKQTRIAKAFGAVSRKLAHSFVYCLPRALPLHMWSNRFAAKTIFKLAVLCDVYKQAAKWGINERVESLFEGVVAAVGGAKIEARRRRNWSFYCRVMGMVDCITKDSLAASALAEQENECAEHKGDETTSKSAISDDKKKAMRRYRALIGLGDEALSRDQLFRFFSDLVRINPWIPKKEAATALDQVLDMKQG